MIITYLGHEAFKIQFGDTVIAVNPPSKDSKHKASRFGADIALVSLNDADFNGVENVTHGERVPFSVTGPGEYEIKGIFVKGFKSESHYGGSKDPRIIISALSILFSQERLRQLITSAGLCSKG